MRVIQVVLSLHPGGTERLVIELAKRLVSPVRTMVCCLDSPGAWAGELPDSVPLVSLERRPGFRPSLALRLARLARDYRADILHCHQYSPFVYGALAACLVPRLRIVFTEHGRLSPLPATLKRRVATKCLGWLPADLHAVCEDLRRSMITDGFPANRIQVIPNGVDPGASPTQLERLALRKELGVEPDSFLIGTVARLDPVKDIATLLEGFALLRSQLSGAKLVVVGDGPEKPMLEALAARLSLASDVQFLGHRDDARRLLGAFDMYVNTSVSEGLSVTILEAMAASLPIVATDVGGNSELLVEAIATKRGNVRRDLRRALTLVPGLEPKDWTPRELRHSFVSLLSDAGVPVEMISQLVGHRGTSVTEIVYRHQIRPVIQTGATVMDELFGQVGDAR